MLIKLGLINHLQFDDTCEIIETWWNNARKSISIKSAAQMRLYI